MNELINSYIEQNKSQVNGSVFESTINLSVERLASRLKRTPIEQVASSYHRDAFDFVFAQHNIETGKRGSKAEADLYALDTLRGVLEIGSAKQYLQRVFFDCSVFADSNETASFEDLREIPVEGRNNYGFNDFAIWIPLEKWLYVEPLLALYASKCEQYLRKSEYDEVCKNMDYIEIFQIINSCDKTAELVEKITEKLKFKGDKWIKVLQK